MFDIFFMEDVHKLIKKKSIVFLGDSNVRALYKDFLCLLNNSKFISDQILRTKMEDTVFGDKLVYHGMKTNARCYREEREASIESTRVSFFFLTKIYDGYVKEVLNKITKKSKPDVIVVNSCLWDITRWGCDGAKQFKENLNCLIKEFKILFPDSLIIWLTAPPIASELRGGFLVKELQFLKYSLRFHVVEANHYARKVVVDNGFDVLDTHYHLQMQIHRRKNDGIHWEPKAVRYITNLLLRHISLSWDIPLPHRYKPISVDENLLAFGEATNPVTVGKKEEKNVHDKTQICPKKSTASSESKENMPKAINTAEKPQEKNSVPLCKVPRKEESIHSYMTNNEKKARKKRIHKQRQNPLDNPHIACNSTAINPWVYPPVSNFQQSSTTGHPSASFFHQNFSSNTTGHPSASFVHQNFSSNPNHAYFPSYNFNYQGTDFFSNGVGNLSNYITHLTNNIINRFQNYGQPYVFPSVAPGQLLQPNLDFTSDEIPKNFRI